MEIISKLISSGFDALLEYLSYHVLTCLVPAFFIAGAIAVFVSKESVLKYFGPRANRVLSYGVASVSGTILAVCSCTILPLFAGIWMSGAGLGPAIAFLYSGPAINILAITYSAKLLGLDLGIGRAVGAILFSVVIGLIMAFIYRREEMEKRADAEDEPLIVTDERGKKKSLPVYGVFFAALVGILIFGASKKVFPTGLSFLVLGGVVYRYFDGEELKQWMRETWDLAVKIFPVLIVGVFIAGALKAVIPPESVARLVGNNGVVANLIASVTGTLFYFSTLTEVPIIRALMDMGMVKGPALALLLSGPALSLPSIIVLSRIMGLKKTLVYVALVVVFSTAAGMLFGAVAG
ncbi:MAG: permease [Deltaproteobacteria bacterium]|nr:MAG: permease [Deltaproteobacteria bacterium]